MILFLILWPLATALGLYAFRPANAKVVAFASSLVELVVSLLIVIQFEHQDAAVWAYQVPWVPSLGINFSVGMDGISLLLVLLTTGLVPFILLSSFKMPNQKSANFYALVLVMQMALGRCIHGFGWIFILRILGNGAHPDLFHLFDLGR